MDLTGTIFRIARYSVHDGPGIRTTVFLKGCPLQCWWCHSPESQAIRPQLALRPDRCAGCASCVPVCPHNAIHSAGDVFLTDRGLCAACGTCVEACPSGARELIGLSVSVGDLVAEIEKDVVFFDESGGGVTFSGGEPLMQPEFLEAALEWCKALRIHTVVDTCGFADRRAVVQASGHTDLFLFDLKVVDEARHRLVTGVSNEPILGNLRELAARGARVRIRFPLVPGVNDDEPNLEAVGRLLREIGLRDVDLLPYHRAGLAKYARFDLVSRLPDTEAPPEPHVTAVAARLAEFDLAVHVGG